MRYSSDVLISVGISSPTDPNDEPLTASNLGNLPYRETCPGRMKHHESWLLGQNILTDTGVEASVID
jgi:hypothetical protein